MSVANISTKRPSEAMIEPAPKKPAYEPIDYSPLFFTIAGTVTDNTSLSTKDVATLLSQDYDTLILMQQDSVKKIQEQFQALLETLEEFQDWEPEIFEVLNRLYTISLYNSSTKIALESTAKELPVLQKKCKGNIKQEIEDALNEARLLLDASKHCTTSGQIQKFLPKIDQLLLRLNDYRLLKQYSNPQENQRIIDLADILKTKRASQQYPNILSDYPLVTHQIQELSTEIALVSEFIPKLNSLKLQLQKNNADEISQKEAPHPLETRFLKAYAPAFYGAFATYFWDLLNHSLEDTEILEIAQEILDWKDVNSNEIDFTSVCTIWDRYLPDQDFSDWMLRILESKTPFELDLLEQQLQELSKASNQARENNTLAKETKTKLQEGFLAEMQRLCFSITQPALSTLKELKTFLVQKTEK